MPRLTPRLIQHASRIDRRLPLLLPECRDLPSARNELRWMKEDLIFKHVPQTELGSKWHVDESSLWQRGSHLGRRLDSWVGRRARAEPLQYVMGTQPFGDLTIKCRSDVLIPRPETETYTTELARILAAFKLEELEGLTIADFCTGSGCIALHMLCLACTSSLSKSWVEHLPYIRGFDISQRALALAKENLRYNIEKGYLHKSASEHVSFEEIDVLQLGRLSTKHILGALFDGSPITDIHGEPKRNFDIILSNPPYISPEQYMRGPTTKSVRKYEPELALVPPKELCYENVGRADQFYAALLRIANATDAKVLVMEVGDTMQAGRVRTLCQQGFAKKPRMAGVAHPLVELWRDDGSVVYDHDQDMCGTTIDYHDEERDDGKVECRAVVVWLDYKWIAGRQASRHSI